VFDVRVIKKINRTTGVRVEESVTGRYSPYGLAVFVASGKLQYIVS